MGGGPEECAGLRRVGIYEKSGKVYLWVGLFGGFGYEQDARMPYEAAFRWLSNLSAVPVPIQEGSVDIPDCDCNDCRLEQHFNYRAAACYRGVRPG